MSTIQTHPRLSFTARDLMMSRVTKVCRPEIERTLDALDALLAQHGLKAVRTASLLSLGLNLLYSVVGPAGPVVTLDVTIADGNIRFPGADGARIEMKLLDSEGVLLASLTPVKDVPNHSLQTDPELVLSAVHTALKPETIYDLLASCVAFIPARQAP